MIKWNSILQSVSERETATIWPYNIIQNLVNLILLLILKSIYCPNFYDKIIKCYYEADHHKMSVFGEIQDHFKKYNNIELNLNFYCN